MSILLAAIGAFVVFSTIIYILYIIAYKSNEKSTHDEALENKVKEANSFDDAINKKGKI